MAMEKIICPHCGAENIKSSIITTCTRCLESLKGAKDAPTELPVATAPPSPEPVELIPDERAAEPGLFAEPPVAPEPVPPTARPARRRAIGEQTSKKAGNALGCGCLVAIALGVVLAKFVHLHVAASIGLAVLCFAVLTAAIVLIQQHAARVASNFYEASIEEPQWYFAPGQSFEAPITVRAKRDLRIGDA
ncbi:MAG: hypothetical protein ACE5JM_10955, partial [Armatimonadota bacterium]